MELTVGLFIRNYFIRRKRLNQNWALGMKNGISKTEFNRLLVTVLSVLVLYLPLSIYILIQYVKLPRLPFDWEDIHGPLWGVIVMLPADRVPWTSWIGPALALTSFFFIGFTRNARRFYESCIEWVYDRLPAKFQSHVKWMGRISANCKELRDAKMVQSGAAFQSPTPSERYHFGWK